MISSGGVEMGVFLVLLSAISFSFSSYFGKIVTNTTNMNGVVTSFGRFFLGLIIMVIYILYRKKSFRAPDVKSIAERAIYNSFAIVLYSAAYGYTTVTNVNMLHMTYPIFVFLFAPYFTKETVDKRKYIYLFIIMLGSYIVANPSFGNINVGDLMALGSATIASLSILSLTKASRKNESYIIIFYVMLIGTIVNIPFAFKDLLGFEMAGLFPAFMASLLGVIGQVLITLGYKYVDSSTGALVSSSRTVIGGIIGALFLGEVISLRILIGMVLITGSLIGLSGYFTKEDKKEEPISNVE